MFESINLFVGFVSGIVTCAGAGYAVWKRRQRARIKKFHDCMNPLLDRLRNGLGQKLTAEEAKIVVETVVKLASQANFGKDRPPPDPQSLAFANKEYTCQYCSFEMTADETGSCSSCGLGCGHWHKDDSQR